MMNLKKAVFFAVIFNLIPLLLLSAQEGQDLYGDASDYLNDIYGEDGNSGLTAFPVLNIPMGGRSEGMAGAFSAVSDDISFIEFNPAGSSMLNKSEFAFFHNNWVADTKIEGVAYANRIGDFGYGAGAKLLYSPFTEYNIYGERVSNGYYSEGVVILNLSYNLFSSYYFSGVSLGINLKGAFRMMPDFTDSFDNIIKNSGFSQSAVMGMADIGILTRFNLFKSYQAREKNAAFALVVRNLGPPAIDEALPTIVNAAISFKPFRPITLALDFCLPLNLLDLSLSEKPYGALGLSVNFTSFLSMRAGLMVKPGTSRITIGSAVNLKDIAVEVNYTLDFLTQMQPLNRISLGVRFDLGDNGRTEIANKVDELYLLGYEAFSRGNLADARLCWEEALKINPRYEPAREAIAMLEDRDGLTSRIEDLYRLDY